MSDQAGTNQVSDRRLEAVYRAISAELGVGRHFIEGPSRLETVVEARVVAIGVMRRLGMSWPAIGAVLNRSQSSVCELWRDRGGESDLRWHLNRAWGRLKVSETHDVQISAKPACRVCGCTDERACVDDEGEPCCWIEADLCSACADDMALKPNGAAEGGGDV